MMKIEGSVDETDQLFAKYLKSQIPHPWPGCPALAFSKSYELLQTNQRPEKQSRLALAASIGLLLGIGLYLTAGHQSLLISGPSSSPTPGLLKTATAEGKNVGAKGLVPVDGESKRR